MGAELGVEADGFIAAVGGSYEFTRFASANLREKDDSLNTAIGGFLAGSVLGLRGSCLKSLSLYIADPSQLVQLLRSWDSVS